VCNVLVGLLEFIQLLVLLEFLTYFVLESAGGVMAPLIVAGYLRMSEKSKRMNSQGKELFRFVPISSTSISEVYSDFDANRATVLVASGAASDRKKGKQKGDSFMPDLYVLAEIIDEDRKGDEWKARLVEVLGECTDLHSCGLVLAHKGRLMDENKPLDTNKPPRADTKKAGAKTVFDKKVTAPAPIVVPSPQRVLSEERVDLRTSKCTIFSVDPPGCVDIDDAVHIRVYSPEERTPLEASVSAKLGLDALPVAQRSAALSNTVLYEVGVHIADVVNYVQNHCHAADAAPGGGTPLSSEVVPGAVDARMEKIVLEALHRSFTVYLPNQQIPILPAYLSHDACSLRAGEDRYTMSCILTIASTADSAPTTTTHTPATHATAPVRTFVGENTSIPLESPPEERNYKIVSYRFQKSLISSAGAFTYDQIDQFLDNTAPAITATTSTPTPAGGAGAAKSAPKGTDSAPTKALPKEVKYSLKLFRKIFPSLDSHKIVEQLMLMANICAAEFLQANSGAESAVRDVYSDTLSAYLLRRQLPAGYDPLSPSSTSGSGSSGSSGVKGGTTQRGAYNGVPVELTAHPAEYIFCPADSSATGKSNAGGVSTAQDVALSLTAIEKAHASLGCAVYTHFTSPIRRYADQLVHALMNRLLSNTHAAAAAASLSTSVSALSLHGAVQRDPWIETFTPANVAHINAKQKQHKKFQREMTIVEFVFNQCAAVGSNEATVDAEAVVLPMRYSDKHRGYKADLFILAPCSFVYPLRLHTRAQAHLYEASYRADGFSLKNNQTGEVRNLFAGQKIPVQVHCIKSAASLRKKCVVSSPSITF